MRRLLVRVALAFGAVACLPVRPTEHIGATPPPAPSAQPSTPLVFELPSVDDRSVSAPAFRGKPAVLAFVVSDSLAGQAEADILATLAQQKPEAARYAIVAVEPEERHELVEGFVRFFADKAHGQLFGAMAYKDMLLGQGPFGDVRDQTVIVLDRAGRVILRETGVVSASDIARALATM